MIKIKLVTIYVLMLLPSFLIAQAAKELYVSTTGKDVNEGTKQKPFASIDRAKLEVRKMTGKVTVFLREGTYYLNHPVVFSLADSRKKGGSVVYKAVSNEKVIISSAVPLRLHWSKFKGNIIYAHVNNKLLFDQLFVNGHLQHMARYPNYDSSAINFNGTASDAISIGKVKAWKKPGGGYIHALHKSGWGDMHYLITGKNDKNELQIEGGWQNNRRMGMNPNFIFVENIWEELDAPNEWYFNKELQMLFFYPPANIDLKNILVETPQLKSLFEFKGSEKEPVENISIEGIELTHTVRTFMETREPLLRSDWTIYRGGAVIMEGAKNCTIKNCYFYTIGGNGIFFSGYNRSDEVSGCHFNKCGASAVCFAGESSAVRSPVFEYHDFIPYYEIDKTPGPKSNNFPSKCFVYDNLIHDIGQVEKQVAGVEISMSEDITVSHNSIYNVPRAGINIGDGCWGGHLIEYNDVFNTVLETSDHGAFNAWGRDRYWYPRRDLMDSIVAGHRDELVLLDAVKTIVIRNNRFRCDHGWDIDLDDGSSNYYIYNNVLLNGGLKLREGFFRKVENNIIINNSFHPHVWFKNSDDVFTRNIVSTRYYPVRISVYGKKVDDNIFLDSLALLNEQRLGHDEHSIYSKPLFADATKGDYRMTKGSAAFDIGFKNFSMDSFGVVSPALKLIAMQAPLPKLDFSFTAANIEVFEILGMQLKDVNNGERSATGMDAERGLFVIYVKVNSPFYGYLKPGDVILSFNGRETRNVRVVKESKIPVFTKGIIAVKIFRNQSEVSVNVPSK